MRIAITNEHRAVLDGNDTRVGDGDFEDVGSQVFEASFTGGYRLAVDVPGDVPDSRWDLIEQLGLLDQIAELGSEEYRERFDGEKEIDSGRMPRAIGRTDSAARNDVVNVGMVLKSSSPGVQDAEEAGEIGPDGSKAKGQVLQSRIADRATEIWRRKLPLRFVNRDGTIFSFLSRKRRNNEYSVFD